MVKAQGGASRPFRIDGQEVPVSLRRSPRAKRVWLTIRPGQGLTLTLPYALSEHDVPDILERHREWIRARVTDMARKNEAPWHSCLPADVELRCLEHVFPLRYHHDGSADRVASDHSGVDIWCQPGDERTAIALVQQWLLQLGRRVLPSYGQRLAAVHNITVTRWGVRNQHTRWGSCSIAGAISLNAKLLLLPRAWVEHVILHELAHIGHHNHGPAYKTRLKQLDPQAEEHDRQLRAAWADLPAWTKIR